MAEARATEGSRQVAPSGIGTRVSAPVEIFNADAVFYFIERQIGRPQARASVLPEVEGQVAVQPDPHAGIGIHVEAIPATCKCDPSCPTDGKIPATDALHRRFIAPDETNLWMFRTCAGSPCKAALLKYSPFQSGNTSRRSHQRRTAACSSSS